MTWIRCPSRTAGAMGKAGITMKQSKRKKDEWKQLPVSDIYDNPYNPRTITAQSPGMTELIEGVKVNGVQQAITVRPTPLADPPRRGRPYLLVAGSRRMFAALASSTKTVPAIVKYGLTDEQACALTTNENLDRKDLSPLEEGKAVQNLLEMYKGDARAAASRIGKSEKWIRTRARIQNHLAKDWQKHLAENPEDNWTAGHLGLLARLPDETQQEVKNTLFVGEVPTISELEKIIQDLLRALDKTPWELDDETLIPKAGSCMACAKQTLKQPGLWEDREETPPQKFSRCLDAACYNRKQLAHLQRRRKELGKEHKDLVTVASERFDYYEQTEEVGKQFPGLLFSIDYHKVKKTDKQAIPALVIHGKEIGKLIWIKKGAKDDQGGKDKKGAKGEKGTVTTLQERRQRLDSKRWCQVLIELRETLEETDRPVMLTEGDNNELKVAALAAIFGTEEREEEAGPFIRYENKRSITIDGWKRLDRVMKELRVVELYNRLWQQVRGVLLSRLTYPGGVTQLNKKYIQEARQVGKLIGVDVDELCKKVSREKGFTEPKAWANLQADGTPKKMKNEK